MSKPTSHWQGQPRTQTGQWSEFEHGRPVSELPSYSVVDREIEIDWEGIGERADAISEAGYVSATAYAIHGQKASSVEGLQDWWSMHFTGAEYTPEAQGAIPQMPDDNTPNMTGGHALSKHRRTHRWRYAGSDVELRVPNTSAIKRFAAEGNSTFDVPFSADYPGGQIGGWLRVTNQGDRWHVSGINLPEDAEPIVTEALSAVLEARRPTQAIGSAESLIASYHARNTSRGSELKAVDSSFVDGVAYDEESGVATVSMNGGDARAYYLDPETMDRLMNSGSTGKAYNKYVKNKAEHAEVDRCPDCGRFTTVDIVHDCPIEHAKYEPGVNDPYTIQARIQGRNLAQSLAATVGNQATQEASTPSEPAPAFPGRHIDLGQFLRDCGRKPMKNLTIGNALYGQRGWTTSAARGLAPFTSSDYVPYAYSLPGEEYGYQNGATGLVYYDGAGSDAAEALLSHLPQKALDEEAHNDGPNLRRILEASRDDDSIRVGGYLVGPDRSDERVSVTNVWIDAPSAAAAREKLEAVDPEIASSIDSVLLMETPWDVNSRQYYIRWD